MLIGNRSAFHKLPIRFLAGSTTTSHGQLRSGFGQAGMWRNRFYQDGSTVSLKTYSYPQGAYAPSGSETAGSAYILPQKSGAMASFNEAGLALKPTASIAGGVTTTGNALMAINFATATGGLISSGDGTAALTFTANGTVLATRSGAGSADFSITTNTPLLGALGWVSATGAFSVTSTLTSYARGFMVGSTVDSTTLTTAAILAAMNASPPDVNIKKVNGVTIQGAGVPGNSMRPL
jgi:hypothetical protein